METNTFNSTIVASPAPLGQQQGQTSIIDIDGIQATINDKNDIIVLSTAMRAESDIHCWVTRFFLKAYEMKHGYMVPDNTSELVAFINALLMSFEFSLKSLGATYNKFDKAGNPLPLYPVPHNVPPVSIAIIASSSGRFIRMRDESGIDMMMFQFRGGLLDRLWRSFSIGDQSIAETEAFSYLEQFDSSLKVAQKKDIIGLIRTNIPLIQNEVSYVDMIPFKNGVFVYESDFTGKLIPWEDVPSTWIFKYKIPYDFHNVTSFAEPAITEPDGSIWTPSKCIQDLFDDTEHATALLEIMAAALRPARGWDKCAIFLDGNHASGNNGKSMILELLARFLGDEVPELKIGQVKALDMNTIGERFALMGTEHASLIVSHENVKDISDKAMAVLKTIIKGNAVNMDRKNQAPITVRLQALPLFAFNNLPVLGDKSGSVARRLITLKFPHCFTGKEKSYIDKDYLHRSEVIEWLLWYLVTKIGRMPDSLPDHDFYHTNSKEFMAKSDPVISFMKYLHDNEVLEGDDAPTVLSREDLYVMYCMYYMQEYNTTVIPKMSNPEFSSRLATAVANDPVWRFSDSPRTPRKNDVFPSTGVPHWTLNDTSKRSQAMNHFAQATKVGLYRYIIAINKETGQFKDIIERGTSPDMCTRYLECFLAGPYVNQQRNCIYRNISK